MSEKDAKAWMERVAPEIQDFLNRVAGTNPQACMTGFIFSAMPKAFIKFGNIGNTGDELVRIHHVLSNLVGEVKRGNYPDTPFMEVIGALYAPGSPKADPAVYADELATTVLMTGMDEKYQNKCMELAQKYLDAKVPPTLIEKEYDPLAESPNDTI